MIVIPISSHPRYRAADPAYAKIPVGIHVLRVERVREFQTRGRGYPVTEVTFVAHDGARYMWVWVYNPQSFSAEYIVANLEEFEAAGGLRVGALVLTQVVDKRTPRPRQDPFRWARWVPT